ncbi:LysR family transcriptional regulator [Paracoccus caeni]|uniref:LysR family transcriptional regulator n=1 Tax=Paracoccus caeni TaxID=657651 RepID=A0A934SH48_9RHOB|nr:LysR substrate-binding domain-containing protein [Paracoccus caeni]MBK4217344.1 LysR family transcriptional regulator [Paracoccus caeni]
MHQLNRISLSGLRAIETTARLGSLSAAAEELGVTPGAVSQRISRTEAQLGQPVFHRSGTGLLLTDLGRDVTAALSRGMAELAAAVALADPAGDDLLNVSVAPLFASRWLIWRLPRFNALYPDIRVRIEPVSRMVTPGPGGIDLCIRVGKGDWPDVRLERLLDQRVLPVCAPTLAAKIDTPADLLRQPVIRENDRLAGWREWLSPHGLAPDAIPGGPVLADGGLCLDAAISGQGVFMAWETLASDALSFGQLVAPLPGRIATGDSYWFVTAKTGRRKPAIVRFRDWLRGELAETSGHWPE